MQGGIFHSNTDLSSRCHHQYNQSVKDHGAQVLEKLVSGPIATETPTIDKGNTLVSIPNDDQEVSALACSLVCDIHTGNHEHESHAQPFL